MPRLLAATVSLALVCHGGAFSGTGSILARPCSGAQHSPAWPPRAGGAGRTSRAFAAGGRHATGGCPAHHLCLPSARGTDQPTRMRAKSDGVTGADTEVRQDHESYLVDRMARVPILGIFVRFARWVASIFRSILLVRMAVLLQAVAQAKTALLDPQRRLSAPGNLDGTKGSAPSESSSAAAKARSADAGKTACADWEPITSSEVAFQAFWSQMDELSSNPSVQGELAMLQAESARRRAIQEEELAVASGIQLSVLDFVEHGGLPPSVEALTAWLEIRDIDTSKWGKGEAKTVQEFFHELWAGESEQLGTASQRVISVVKVRILDASADGTWQLYETKQTLCRDGRTRPRNRPLAEKLRPGEAVEDCCVRGVREELGSLVGTKSRISIREGSMQHWEETRMSRSFPGLETLYKLYQVDVEVDGLTLRETGENFDTEEDPELSTGKVHRWQWVPCGGVDWDPISTT